MTHKGFIDKWIGRYLDYDKMFGYQCVDLMRAYTKEVHGLAPYTAIPTRGNAKDIFNNFKTNSFYTKVLNSPNNMPKQGDIVFFKTSLWYPWLYGIAGHVAVVDSAGLYKMICFNQNYPTGKPCQFGSFTYKDCLGWLTRN